MTKDKSRIQSCVDHINTAVDVDPWAKELVAEMGKEALKKLNNSKEDAISRQAAIDCVTTGAKPTTIRGRIAGLPSVQPELCEDAVSREAVSKWLKQYGQDVLHGKYKFSLMYIWKNIMDLPSVQPYTDEEIQKMQDLQQAEVEKAFELGREDARSEVTHCGECKHKGTKNCVANVWAAILGVTVKDDFYCGLAERRTDGSD